MAKFTFALEPLLKARRLTEQSHQRIVAQIESERRNLEDQLRHLRQTISDGRMSMRSRLVGVIDAQSLRVHAADSTAMMCSVQRLALELASVHRGLEAARSELVEASRRRRAIEILRERRFDDWKTALHKSETKALDELAANQAVQPRSA